MDALCSPNHIQTITTKEEDITFGRQSADFQPTIWGDYFIAHPPLPNSDHKNSSTPMELKATELRKLVRIMWTEINNDVLEKMKLIDSLQRLGLEYHFQEEISKELRCIHSMNADHNNLHAVTLHFCLLRQQGYNVGSDMFKKLKDDNGDFKESLSSDAKGLFSLYEATFLATREDHILEEAKGFARVHLESMIPHMEPALAAQTKRALVTPFFRGIRHLEARYYISIYQEDKTHNPVLLQLAKIDFNMLQLMHQADLASVSKWWKELDFATKCSFARNRVVECYFWGSGVHFYPQYSQAKLFVTKMAALLTIVDDIFDVHGTIEELEKFTDVFQRWEFQDVDELPEYMQIVCSAFACFMQEVEDSMQSEERITYMHFLAKVVKELIAAYYQEAKWASKGYMPTFEEYIGVSMISFGYVMSICSSIIFSGEKVSKEGLEWVSNAPKIVEAASLVGRLMDDLANKIEKERHHVPTSVQCYMNQYGVSEEETRGKLQEKIENAWKDINHECLKVQPLELWPHLIWVIDYARVTEVIYKHGDSFTYPTSDMKEHIIALFADPIPDAM